MSEAARSVSLTRLVICGAQQVGKSSLKHALFNKPIPYCTGSTQAVTLRKTLCHIFDEPGKCNWPKETDSEKHQQLLLVSSMQSLKSLSMRPRSTSISSSSDGKGTQSMPNGTRTLRRWLSFPQVATRASEVKLYDAVRSGLTWELHDERLHFFEIWDLGGHSHLPFLQSMLFANRRTQYLLAFDSSIPMDAIVERAVRSEKPGYNCMLAGSGYTQFEIIEEWLSVLFMSVTSPTRVRLVGTKIDKVGYFSSDRDACKEKTRAYIRERLKDKPYAKLLDLEILFIDNTRSSPGFFSSADPVVFEILERVRDVAKQDLANADPVPSFWLAFGDALQKTAAKDSTPILTLDDVVTKARELCGIAPCDVPALLKIHHDLGHLLHFQDERTPDLCQQVVVDIYWLLRITSALFQSSATGNHTFQPHFDLLFEHGILLDSLALHIWETNCPVQLPHLQSPERRHFIFGLLEKFRIVYKLDKSISPGEHLPSSSAWFCPQVIQRAGVAASYSSAGNSGDSMNRQDGMPFIAVWSPAISLHCDRHRRQRHFPRSQFWQVVVKCMCFFREKSVSQSNTRSRSQSFRKPFVYRSSARLPCNKSFPCHQLCLTYFDQGVELAVVREEEAFEDRKALGKTVQTLDEVCRAILELVENALVETGESQDGRDNKLTWHRAARCHCDRSQKPCSAHSRPSCPSPGCHHFVWLSDEDPFCPFDDQPLQLGVLREVYPVWLKVRSRFTVVDCIQG